MAFLILIISAIILNRNGVCGDACVCDQPQCIGVSVPPTGMARSVPGGLLLTDKLHLHPQLDGWVSAKSGIETLVWDDGAHKSAQVKQETFDLIQGTKMEMCDVKLERVDFTTYALYPFQGKDRTVGIMYPQWDSTHVKYNLTQCLDSVAVFACTLNTLVSSITQGCPPEECYGKEGMAFKLTATDTCGIDKGFGHPGIPKGDPDKTKCCTQHGCHNEQSTASPSPVLVSSGCYFQSMIPTPSHVIPNQLGFVRTSGSELNLGPADKHGWQTYNIASNDELGFIKCCGFLLGVGGALFQAYLNNEGQGGGGADAGDVRDKINSLIGEINRVDRALQAEIDNLKQVTVQNQMMTLKNQVQISLLASYLNISSWLDKQTIGQLEEKLQKDGWCRQNNHCWCPPIGPTAPAPISTIDPIKTVGGISWWMLLIQMIIALLVVSVIIGIMSKICRR